VATVFATVGFDTSGTEQAGCTGGADQCSDEAFSAFEGTTTTVVVNGNTSPDVPLDASRVAVLGAVEQQTQGVNKAVSCASSIVMPFIPAPNPDDLSGLLLDKGQEAAEMAAGKAGTAAERIKQASRLGPSRLNRTAKLEG